ncbi:helix-turn-helix domain-containing protein [Serratia nevei]|uniref:helix-turn-helix domain-containing protein n=1 Tax=Serratia nevei TaxID=2703794 RepID=UPI00399A6059
MKTQPATGETYPKSDLFNKASTDRKIIDIALEYGYLEQQAFCRIFKNHYGVSPTMFRKMNKPREDIWISAKTVLLKLTNDRK